MDKVVRSAEEAVADIGEVEELLGVFVQRVVALTPEQAADKQIEKRTVRTV